MQRRLRWDNGLLDNYLVLQRKYHSLIEIQDHIRHIFVCTLCSWECLCKNHLLVEARKSKYYKIRNPFSSIQNNLECRKQREAYKWADILGIILAQRINCIRQDQPGHNYPELWVRIRHSMQYRYLIFDHTRSTLRSNFAMRLEQWLVIIPKLLALAQQFNSILLFSSLYTLLSTLISDELSKIRRLFWARLKT